jgi:hypothetical protein
VKRTLALAVVFSALTVTAVSATAAPKAKGPKPVTVVHHFHGDQPTGEVHYVNALNTPGFQVMDTTAPTGASAKSAGVTNYTGGPNTDCSGNELFPVWSGAINGAPVGDVTVDLVLQGVVGGGQVEVKVFADIFEGGCNELAVPALGGTTITLASGQTSAKAVIKGINKKAKAYSSLLVQVSPVPLQPPFIARVAYDAASADSKMTFTCIPKAGKKAC